MTYLWSGPLMVGTVRRRFDRLLGVLLLELRGAQVTEGGVQAAGVIDLFDEAWQLSRDVSEGLKCHRVHTFDLERLHEALSLGVIVGIAAPAHRANKPVLGQPRPIRLGSVLTTAVRVMGQSWRWSTTLDRRAQS